MTDSSSDDPGSGARWLVELPGRLEEYGLRLRTYLESMTESPDSGDLWESYAAENRIDELVVGLRYSQPPGVGSQVHHAYERILHTLRVNHRWFVKHDLRMRESDTLDDWYGRVFALQQSIDSFINLMFYLARIIREDLALPAQGLRLYKAPQLAHRGTGPIHLPDLSADEDSATFAYQGRRLDLGAGQDFKVLRALHRAGGEVVGYGQLFDMIKPGERDSREMPMVKAPKELTDAVNHIRKAFMDAKVPCTVVSIRGRGFRLSIVAKST